MNMTMTREEYEEALLKLAKHVEAVGVNDDKPIIPQLRALVAQHMPKESE